MIFFALLWFLLSHLVISYMCFFNFSAILFYQYICHSILALYLASILKSCLAYILTSSLAFFPSYLFCDSFWHLFWLFILAPSLTFFHMGTAHVDLELEIYKN